MRQLIAFIAALALSCSAQAQVSAFTAGPLGIGVTSPNAVLDVESAGAVGGGNANGTLARFYAGSNASPITAITPTFAISRYETINQDTEGGQNAALYVEDVGNNVSSGSTVAQVNGITANVFQNGTGDSVGMFAYSTNSSTNAGHTAYGGFFDAIANSLGTHAFGLEIDSTNNTGVDVGYSGLAPYPALVGIHVQALGNNLNTAGIWIGNVSSTPSYDVGIAFTNDIKTTSIEDDSSSIQAINIAGSHSYGLVLSSGTYTGNAIQATGWQLSPSGMVRTSTNPAATWNTDSTGSTVTIANGGNASLPGGNGLIVAEDSVNSNAAIYLCSVGSCVLIGTVGSTWVTPTTTPAAGKMSIAWSGTAYAIYNNQGSAETVTLNLLKMKASN
ncbi:hypothetical protein [Paraburkholderia diazotrophica]|uniref:Uncharacterized protein n=1 Tax=Paraburkholderia diazotrophica TaxID=667676 RepID=A0A1H6QGA9_9BURK|nr:hypothetical protein [Paraburkholderia diazotrophica]SEI42761.1 hypothetical protein SAMN05192539_1001330 [Paraburkholderia diazotrophica]